MKTKDKLNGPDHEAYFQGSNRRIAEALEVLNGTERGIWSLVDLRKLLTGPALGLDSAGQRALMTLVREFISGRRTFLEDPIVKVSLKKSAGPDSVEVSAARSQSKSARKSGDPIYDALATLTEADQE